MNDLKKALKTLPQPTIEVEKFKRNLRADLLADQSTSTMFSKSAFGLMCGVASTFATLVFLFIANPDYPTRVNAWLTGVSSASSDASLAHSATTQLPTTTQPGTSWVNHPELFYASEAADRKAAEQLFSQDHLSGSSRFQNSSPAGLFTIREFTTDDGKRVLVYTKIDPNTDAEAMSVSY